MKRAFFSPDRRSLPHRARRVVTHLCQECVQGEAIDSPEARCRARPAGGGEWEPIVGALGTREAAVVHRSCPLAPHRSRHPSRFAPFSQPPLDREGISARAPPARRRCTWTALLTLTERTR